MKRLFLVLLIFPVYLAKAQTKPAATKPSKAEVERMIQAAKLNTQIVIGSSKDRPGIGPTDGIPTGTPLKLPPCIRIVDRKNKPFDADLKKLYGSSTTFYVDISFVNDCVKSMDIELPGGLILNSQFRDGQNGLLVERVLVDVPPTSRGGSNQDTTTIYLAVACLNEQRGVPTNAANPDYPISVGSYTVGNVTDDPNLLQLLALLKGKKLAAKKYSLLNTDTEQLAPSENIYSEIQLAIYKVTEGVGLSRGEVEKLKKQLAAYR
jgi:hypothetical protein